MPKIAVKLLDWIPGNDNRPAGIIELASATTTAGEIIRERLMIGHRSLQGRDPVSDLDDLLDKSGVILPGEFEEALNGSGRVYQPGPRQDKLTDFDYLLNAARRAFAEKQFVLLLDNRQLDDWDERVAVSAGSEARFIRLTPLVGG